MKNTVLRNYLSTKILHKLFSRIYTAYSISKANVSKMNEYLDIPNEQFTEVDNYIKECIANKTWPRLSKYDDGAYVVKGHLIGGKSVFETGGTITITTNEDLTDFSLPRELRSFGQMVSFLVFDDWSDQLIHHWEKTGLVQEALNFVGKPADVVAQHKLSQLQKDIIFNIKDKALERYPHTPPDMVRVPWNSTELAPSTHRTHASRCIRELKKRNLLILIGSPRTTHVQLTPVATALVERLEKTGNRK